MKYLRGRMRWGLLLLLFAGVVFQAPLRRSGTSVIQRLKGEETVQSRLEQFGASARSRLRMDFDEAGVTYPPERLCLVAI